MGAAMSKTNVKAQQEKRLNWGNWKLNHETPVLEYANFSLNGAGFYEVDLDRMTVQRRDAGRDLPGCRQEVD